MRRRWRNIGLVVGAALIAVFGYAVWWLVRPPAPTPPGMAGRLAGEQRGFILSQWPEGEAAWPLFGRALTAEGDERIQLAIEASERMRLYESLDALPNGSIALSATPMPNSEMRSLTGEVSIALWYAMVDDDVEHARELLLAAMRLHTQYLQHTGLITSMSVSTAAQHTFELIEDALRQVEISEPVCLALIDEIRNAQLAAAMRDAPIVDANRLDSQRNAVTMRDALRVGEVGDRAMSRLRTLFLGTSADAGKNDYFDDWLFWLSKSNALQLEQDINDHYDALRAWWALAALERPARTDAARDRGAAPWRSEDRAWVNARCAIDELAMFESGVVLLLRLEAHHARTGEWPDSLDAVAAAQEIIDPVTGRAFVYDLVDDPAPGAWPFVLRAPLTVEEFAQLTFLDEGSRPIEELWAEAVTITKKPAEQ